MSNKLQKWSSSSSCQQSFSSSIACDICPHACSIPLDSFGRCGVIQNKSSKIVNAYAGQCSNIAVESIEKRPFFHVLPGSKFLSVGFFGCSIVCNFCLNHRVSQQATGKSTFYSPVELVKLALEYNVEGIAFTYNEPTVYYDYIEKVGHEIGRSECNSHLKLVIKTNGFVRPWVMRNLCLYADAINVDIKGDNEDYEKICGAWISPVLDCVEQIAKMGVHLEISYLVLSNKINDDEFNIDFRDWLARVNFKIPVHLLYFYPFHKMVVPSYNPSKLLILRELMLKKLDYVYISNHFGSQVVAFRNTSCIKCGKIIINRQKGLVTFGDNICCGTKISGVFS